ncbi:unnamed protein product [Clonostachys rosea]|uniref:F-box domain-containing protein n=1 Tax=Bionectria ochroleuca TaxID=29856 RepID=A0ABY6USK6_BIOOC|nr:unnamed protein product [Clonostachys rosea]
MSDTLETPQQRVTLASLPGEVKNVIVGQLEVIGLVGLSQADRHFRSVIKPNKTEMGERLLALVLVEGVTHQEMGAVWLHQDVVDAIANQAETGFDWIGAPVQRVCERWQEIREFRDIPTAVSGMSQCNSCFADKFGREALVQELLPRVKRQIRDQRARIRWRRDVIELDMKRLQSKDPILHRMWHAMHAGNMGNPGRLSVANFVWLHRYHEEYLQLRLGARVLGEGQLQRRKELEGYRGFVPWFGCLDEFEAQLIWLTACEEKIDRDPGLLAEWSLGRDGASLE